jgi:hypothetical protein
MAMPIAQRTNVAPLQRPPLFVGIDDPPLGCLTGVNPAGGTHSGPSDSPLGPLTEPSTRNIVNISRPGPNEQIKQLRKSKGDPE